MPCAPATSAPAAGPKNDIGFSSQPDVTRARDDHQPFGQATQASPSRQRTGRRRFVDPTSSERDRAAAEEEFMRAMSDYRKRSGRMFPTWSEVLEVLQGLGYEKPSCQPTGHDVRSTTCACG
jgi:hypothetical protein